MGNILDIIVKLALRRDGRVWFMAPVLKTGVSKGTGGSNPSLSAKIQTITALTLWSDTQVAQGASLLRR